MKIVINFCTSEGKSSHAKLHSKYSLRQSNKRKRARKGGEARGGGRGGEGERGGGRGRVGEGEGRGEGARGEGRGTRGQGVCSFPPWRRVKQEFQPAGLRTTTELTRVGFI